MYSLDNRLGRDLFSCVQNGDIEKLKSVFKYTDEQVDLMLENKNMKGIIINLYWLFKSNKVNIDRCKRIASMIKQNKISDNWDNIWLLFVNNNLINSEHYDYVIDILEQNFKNMDPNRFNVLRTSMCDTELLNSRHYKYIIDKTVKIKNVQTLTLFTELAKDLIVEYESTLAYFYIEYILDILCTKDFKYLQVLKDYKNLFALLEPEDSYGLFITISKIKNSNALKQVCEILTSLELNNYHSLDKMALYLRTENVTTLKNLNMLFNYSKSFKKSSYFKTNVQDEIIQLNDICKNLTMFTDEDKQKLYHEITKILNFSSESIVAFTLDEIRSELEKYNEETTKVKTKILKPAEERMRFFVM